MVTMQQHNIVKHVYSGVNRKPNPDVRQETALEISLGFVFGFVFHMADIPYLGVYINLPLSFHMLL
jgi:hypothetical protein